MGQKTETLFNQFLIGTGFLTGFWHALELNPKIVLVEQLGYAISLIGTQEMANEYVFYGKLALLLVTLAAIPGSYIIGRKLGLAGLVVMYFAGLTFLTATTLSIMLLLLGMVLGVFAIQVHTDERAVSRQPQPRRMP